MEWKAIEYYLERVEGVGQSQAATHDQLVILLFVANKLGLYDAADTIYSLLDTPNKVS